MNAQPPIPVRAGFTLIEVLAALGLCVLLATTVAAAVAFAARAERMAERNGEAALLLPALYAAQRLRPDDLPAAPRGWRVDSSTDILKISDDLLQEWHLFALAADRDEIRPFSFRILDDVP
mgnify:CR=1 FL=1